MSSTESVNAGQPVPMWLNVPPALTLVLLIITGLYLFALPYFAKRKAPSPDAAL